MEQVYPCEGGKMEFVPLRGSGQRELRVCEKYQLNGLGCKGEAALPTCHSSTRVHYENAIDFLIKNTINQGSPREFAL